MTLKLTVNNLPKEIINSIRKLQNQETIQQES